MRRYQPSTLPALAAGVVPDDDVVVAASEAEDDEYAALMTAADVSAGRVAGLPDGQRRRVVVAFDADGSEMLAVHADTVDDTDPDDELAWYATQEVGSLLSGIV